MKQKKQNPSFAAWLPNPTRNANPDILAALALSTRRGIMWIASFVALVSAASQAAPLFTPGDPVFAYDLDTAGGSTGTVTFPLVTYPANESPSKAIDGSSASKYLSQSKYSAGIIVTPATAAAARSMVLTTANDSAERDPSSYIIFGSNQPITSADKSNGFSDHWTFIAQGALSLPGPRLTTATAIDFANTKTFSSYWIVFPTTKDTVANALMQIAEIQLYTGTGGTGTAIFAPANPTLCTGWSSSVASGEFVTRVIDGNAGTKYLNFGENNSGFFVVPSAGATIVTSFQLTTANDSDVRDPATWQLHGMAPTGIWSLIGSGSVTLPTARGTAGPVVPVSNTNPYLAYRMTFPTVRNAGSANSMQVAEAQLFGTILPANDTDFDGMDDAWEVLYGLTVGVNDSALDTLDSDGSPNLQEYQRGTIPTNPDTDGDGLFDGVETDDDTFNSASDTGSNPLQADSDSDTYPDGYEVNHGTDPNIASAVPTIVWDITPGTAGPGDSLVTGGTGIWDNLTTANWTTDTGINNVNWDNAGQRVSAIFGGTAGTVALSAPVTTDRVIVNTTGYLFTGDALTLGSSAPVINIATGTTEMEQVIAGTAGFTKQGDGILRLTGAGNTYTGTTSLKGIGKIVLAKDAGQIAIPGDVFLDSFSFTPNNSGLVLAGDEQIADTSIISWANVGQADTYFRLNGHKETIGGLVSTGVGAFVVVENRGFGDLVDYATGELVINTTSSNSYSYDGQIRDIDGGTLGGKVAITKDGTGTQILSGTMTYTGPTTVLGGTLQLGSNLASSAVTVEDGGTLAGTAILGQATTVNPGGTISPGADGVGILTTANAIIAGTYSCQISGATADRLTVNGDLDIAGATLQLVIVDPLTANSYILASHTGTLNGTFNVVGLPAGYSIDDDSPSGQIKLVKEGFSAWATLNGLSGDDSDDFDKDGLADGVEYVLGTNPESANANGPTGAVVGDSFTFTFQRDHAAMTEDVTVMIEVGISPETLNTLYLVGADTATSSDGVTVTNNVASDTVTLTIPRAPDDKKFARLRVNITP